MLEFPVFCFSGFARHSEGTLKEIIFCQKPSSGIILHYSFTCNFLILQTDFVFPPPLIVAIQLKDSFSRPQSRNLNSKQIIKMSSSVENEKVENNEKKLLPFISRTITREYIELIMSLSFISLLRLFRNN